MFKNRKLTLLYTDRVDAHKYPAEVIDAFFKVMALIRNAQDERDLRAFHSLNYETLKGNRSHQNSLRLNKQWRLIVERALDDHERVLWIIDIEDYH
ncbi:MAG: type II toxin-antitoxin system RelE/ParE family toxin [Chloroflexi bacterium]|nr:type II toxin-antitoxin system RelE/ParE family toxin [Chloroflexota bacterium]